MEKRRKREYKDEEMEQNEREKELKIITILLFWAATTRSFMGVY
jgi:hypothetical protein